MTEENFFNSETVHNSLLDIVELQTKVLAFAENGEFATIEAQQNNLIDLKELISKQKNLCFRCTLSNSPEAKKLLTHVLNYFEEYGHTIIRDNPMYVFSEIENELDEIEYELKYYSKHGYYPDSSFED